MTQQPWPAAPPQPVPNWGAPPPPAAKAPEGDPFEVRESVPSVSFDKDAHGNRLNPPLSYVMEVLSQAELVQSRDDKGNLEFFLDQYGRPENPKWKVVIEVRMPDGEKRGLWAKKWSAGKDHVPGQPTTLYQAIADAQKLAGQRIGPGGRLSVAWVSTEAPKQASHNGKKLYQAKYEPNVFAVEKPAAADPFANGQPASPGYPMPPTPPPTFAAPEAPQAPPAPQAPAPAAPAGWYEEPAPF